MLVKTPKGTNSNHDKTKKKHLTMIKIFIYFFSIIKQNYKTITRHEKHSTIGQNKDRVFFIY